MEYNYSVYSRLYDALGGKSFYYLPYTGTQEYYHTKLSRHEFYMAYGRFLFLDALYGDIDYTPDDVGEAEANMYEHNDLYHSLLLHVRDKVVELWAILSGEENGNG